MTFKPEWHPDDTTLQFDHKLEVKYDGDVIIYIKPTAINIYYLIYFRKDAKPTFTTYDMKHGVAIRRGASQLVSVTVPKDKLKGPGQYFFAVKALIIRKCGIL